MSISLKPDAIIGIDPGAKGCAVYLSDYVTSIRFGQVEWKDVAEVLKNWCRVGKVKIYFEKVGVMPTDGKANAFKFGHNTGRLEGMLDMLGEAPVMVAPQTWQAHHRLGGKQGDMSQIPAYNRTKAQEKTARKNAHLAKAREIFPDANLNLENCDAYLIAQYGWDLHFGKIEAKRPLRQGAGIIRTGFAADY